MGELKNITDVVSLWDKDSIIPLFTGLKLAPGSTEYIQMNNALSSPSKVEHNPTGIPLYHPSYPSPEKVLKCSHCHCPLSSRDEQVEHYANEWHKFNMKRSLNGLSPVSEKAFINKSWDEDDFCNAENIPSDDNEEEETSDVEDGSTLRRKPQFFFVNVDDELMSIYKNVLRHKKTEINNDQELVKLMKAAPYKLYWIILLVGGGHFSGAVFKGEEIIAHKTFHSYTVRSKQGGSQSSKDNKSATSHPKSAGASLRRYNEMSFNQHVQELLEEWKSHFSDCHLIFFRCPRSNNHLLFAKDSPVVLKLDARLRTIPFPTKKPTFSEVKRVHKALCQIYVHGKSSEICDIKKLEIEKPPGRPKTQSPPKTERQLNKRSRKKVTKMHRTDLDTSELADLSSDADSLSDSGAEEPDIVSAFESMTTDDLNPYGCLATKRQQRNLKKANEKFFKKTSVSNFFLNENNQCDTSVSESTLARSKIEDFVYSACRTGDLGRLKMFRQYLKERDLTSVPDAVPLDIVAAVTEAEGDMDIFGFKFGVHGKSPLHVAAENTRKDLMWWLMEEGCDPCVLNAKNQTPYDAAKVKEAKLHFRRFMDRYPDKYDYKKANIPSPLTQEQERRNKQKIVERKKKLKNVKKEREQKLKEEKEKRLKEEKEKQAYLLLSDREKRAMAAEKRMMRTQSSKSDLRCFLCGDFIAGAPFEYSDYKFCSTSCVKQHRTKLKDSA